MYAPIREVVKNTDNFGQADREGGPWVLNIKEANFNEKGNNIFAFAYGQAPLHYGQ